MGRERERGREREAHHHFPDHGSISEASLGIHRASSLQSESSEILTIKIECTAYLQNNQEANHRSNLRIAFQVTHQKTAAVARDRTKESIMRFHTI